MARIGGMRARLLRLQRRVRQQWPLMLGAVGGAATLFVYAFPRVAAASCAAACAATGGAVLLLWWRDPPVLSLLQGSLAAQPSNAALTCRLPAGGALPPAHAGKVPAADYYGEYHGHPPAHLAAVLRAVRGAAGGRGVAFLAGDSSFDNKFWFGNPRNVRAAGYSAPAVGGYADVLNPPRMLQDVSYWLSREAAEGRGGFGGVVNTAVEASTVADRAEQLLMQDAFIRDNVVEEDVVLVSIGGNDIALRPSLRTAVCMAALTHLAPSWALERGFRPLLPGLGHFVDLFRRRVGDYVARLVARRRPRLVVVCMIYHPNVHGGGSWADATLAALGYDRDPSRLHAVIRLVFERATAQIRIPGVKVLPFALAEVLNGSDPGDYEQRVEPSVDGGRKMAQALAAAIAAAAPPPRS